MESNIHKELILDFYPYAKKQLGFDKPPRLFFLSDEDNAKNPLGKTGYYEPETKSIYIYTINRHPKDIVRSFAHELVHHTQNCKGELQETNAEDPNYAQNDEHLRNMEKDAYQRGNIIFRDWTDLKNKQKLNENKKIRIEIKINENM